MCYSFATYCDLLADCKNGPITDTILVNIILRCMPHVARDTITAVIADMPHKTKDLEMQIFAVFIISKVFDETTSHPLMASAKYAKSIIKNNACLWTAAQQTQFGTHSLTDLFFQCIMQNADVHVFLKHVPKVQAIVKQQFHYYILSKAEALKDYLLITPKDADDYADEDAGTTFSPFLCSGVAHFKKLQAQSFFRSQEESVTFLFNTVPMLQALSTADKTRIASVFM